MKDTLTPNEWIVMNALWQSSPMTLSETISSIGDRVSWGYKTFASYLTILEKKGFLGSEKRGRDKFYYPIASRQDCIASESDSLINKLESGSIKLLMANMVEKGGLSRRDSMELIKLMEQRLEEDSP